MYEALVEGLALNASSLFKLNHHRHLEYSWDDRNLKRAGVQCTRQPRWTEWGDVIERAPGFDRVGTARVEVNHLVMLGP
jgi:hypothetical protein